MYYNFLNIQIFVQIILSILSTNRYFKPFLRWIALLILNLIYRLSGVYGPFRTIYLTGATYKLFFLRPHPTLKNLI